MTRIEKNEIARKIKTANSQSNAWARIYSQTGSQTAYQEMKRYTEIEKSLQSQLNG